MHELDLPRLMELESYWGKHPPLHLMVAGYLGIKPVDSPPVSAEVTEDQMEDLLKHLPLSEPQPFMSSEEYLAMKERQKNGG